MNDLLKTYTLKDFMDNVDFPNGLYAVWVNKLIFDDNNKPLNGLKSSIVTYSDETGFSDNFDWADDFDEREIKVKFLEELAIDFF